MPHSGGGGSHSCGSHSSSHSFGGSHYSHSSGHGGSSGPSGPCRSYYTGASRYIYYNHGHHYYTYSDSNPAEIGFSPVRLLMLLVYIPFFIIALSMIVHSVHVPVKVNWQDEHILDYKPVVEIEDGIHVLSDSDAQQMHDVFQQVWDTTGVMPAFISVSNSDWENNTDLEQEAYDLYVNHFPDECHILIVYSTDPDASSDYDDWHFEIMVGDNAGNGNKGIFTDSTVDDLKEDLQKYFTARTRYSIGQAVSTAFSNRLPSLMNVSLNLDGIFFGIVILLFVSVHAFFMTGLFTLVRARKYKNAVQIANNSVEYKCPYCGVIYTDEVRRRYGKCQSCGAPFPLDSIQQGM